MRTDLWALDQPPEAQQLEKVDLGVVQRAIEEAFVADFRIAMFVGAGLALMSAVVAGIMVEGKGRAVRSEEARQTEGETAPA